MASNQKIRDIKRLAKRFAKAQRISQQEALDFFATEFGFRRWNGLQIESKRGWAAKGEELARLESMVDEANPFGNECEGNFGALFDTSDAVKTGILQDQHYELTVSADDIHMDGEGWRIIVPEAPNASPIVEIDQGYSKTSPVRNSEFLREAVKIACRESESIHARIASDWPRRSTKPDAKGVVRHPLFHSKEGVRKDGDTWFCLHCNGKISGIQIAKNLWHCPACGASPIDIFSEPFWLDESDAPPQLIEGPAQGGRGEPIVKIVDRTMKLELDEEKVTALIRSALMDDANNFAERLGAQLARVSVDEENDVWITFETHYWPEEKQPVQAMAVAEALGLSLDCDMVFNDPLFAWPGIAEFSSNTLEYTKSMMAAYEEHADRRKAK
ncbi:hypothetical protein [Shimia sp. Alg240-R146]|uniref:hypothetical protein n=1 Tax=Shimia sp. Alg240-R146 TaxID=2993449 RepID=UPI0022DFF1C1|nr:hypothetical protein [Shimia sp. Alg240-R146]